MLHWFRCMGCYGFEDATLSMIANDIETGLPPYVWKRINFRQIASIYGAGASGKSNFLKALSSVFINVCGDVDGLIGKTFEFDEILNKAPMRYAINFSIVLCGIDEDVVNICYEYVIQNGKVMNECLRTGEHFDVNKAYQDIFKRNDNNDITLGVNNKIINQIEINKNLLLDWEVVEKKRKSEMLFMRFIYEDYKYKKRLANSVMGQILDWFDKAVILYTFGDGDDSETTSQIIKTANIVADEIKAGQLHYTKELLQMLSEIDPFINGLTVIKGNMAYKINFLQARRETSTEIYPVDVFHFSKENNNNKRLDFRILRKLDNLKEHENLKPSALFPDSIFYDSSGIKKIVGVYQSFINVYNQGGLIIIDELDTKLHPLIIRALLAIFRSYRNENNPSQLIFTSHNLVTLSKNDIHYEEAYFIEKDANSGKSTLNRLSSSSLATNGESYSESYLRGRFGAVPFMD